MRPSLLGLTGSRSIGRDTDDSHAEQLRKRVEGHRAIIDVEVGGGLIEQEVVILDAGRDELRDDHLAPVDAAQRAARRVQHDPMTRVEERVDEANRRGDRCRKSIVVPGNPCHDDAVDIEAECHDTPWRTGTATPVSVCFNTYVANAISSSLSISTQLSSGSTSGSMRRPVIDPRSRIVDPRVTSMLAVCQYTGGRLCRGTLYGSATPGPSSSGSRYPASASRHILYGFWNGSHTPRTASASGCCRRS